MEQYPFERAAARGDPMPDGLTLMEQYAYQAMRYLYASYSARRIPKERAASEKRKILRQLTRALEQEELQRRAYEHTAAMWKAIEAAANRYGTERTLENADAFYEAVYGAGLKRKEEKT